MTFRFYLNLFSVLLVSFTLFSCVQPYNGDKVVEGEFEEVENDQYIFRAVGYASIAAQKGDSFDLQMLNAIKVSKLEAYKELAEQLHGVLLNAENNVNGARLQDDMIKSRVKGLVRGARVLKSYHEGEVYITELELDMQRSPLLSFLKG